jgi:hypothetical protein
MKVLRNIGIGIVALIALLLLIALFIPKSYTVTVSETINQPKNVVYNYLRILGNQEQYSEWIKRDPNLHPQITGIDGSVGAIQKWNSTNDDVGEGEQEIIAMAEDRIDLELRFIRPFKGKAKAWNLFRSLSDTKTELTSKFYTKDDQKDASEKPRQYQGYFRG